MALIMIMIMSHIIQPKISTSRNVISRMLMKSNKSDCYKVISNSFKIIPVTE